MVIGQATGANDRIVIQSSVGNSTVGFIPLQGNNVTLGNTTNRWHNASFTNANTSGTFVSTGDITAGADVDITGEANTATLRVRSTSAMGGKLTISSGGASITVTNANKGNSASFNGGIGVSSSITGSAVLRGGGGAAGGTNAQSASKTGGTGVAGGGNGGNYNGGANGANGAANTGGGGGGSGAADGQSGYASGNGGSGVIIIRYKLNEVDNFL